MGSVGLAAEVAETQRLLSVCVVCIFLESDGLKDGEMRATVYLAGRLKQQNGDESRAGKGIKSLSTGLCNCLLHYMKPCLIQGHR